MCMHTCPSSVLTTTCCCGCCAGLCSDGSCPYLEAKEQGTRFAHRPALRGRWAFLFEAVPNRMSTHRRRDMRFTRHFWRAILVVTLLACVPASYSQSTTSGYVTGSVTDASKALIK